MAWSMSTEGASDAGASDAGASDAGAADAGAADAGAADADDGTAGDAPDEVHAATSTSATRTADAVRCMPVRSRSR